MGKQSTKLLSPFCVLRLVLDTGERLPCLVDRETWLPVRLATDGLCAIAATVGNHPRLQTIYGFSVLFTPGQEPVVALNLTTTLSMSTAA